MTGCYQTSWLLFVELKCEFLWNYCHNFSRLSCRFIFLLSFSLRKRNRIGPLKSRKRKCCMNMCKSGNFGTTIQFETYVLRSQTMWKRWKTYIEHIRDRTLIGRRNVVASVFVCIWTLNVNIQVGRLRMYRQFCEWNRKWSLWMKSKKVLTKFGKRNTKCCWRARYLNILNSSNNRPH